MVTTVRSAEKGDRILGAFSSYPKGQISYVVVPDIAQESAFDQAIVSDPPFDAVIHTASPFHFQFQNPEELLGPAVQGTKGILKAIQSKAPTVTRVVITSSFAAITQVDEHPAVYDESQWNPVTYEEGMADHSKTYLASKALAERAAWSFMDENRPNFSLATICPPWVFGPVSKWQAQPGAINTSNAYLAPMLQGAWKNGLPPTAAWLWSDVRDIALAHVKAMEVPGASGKRFFTTSGHFDMKEVAEIVKTNFPEYANKLPDNLLSDKPNPLYGYDNSRSKSVLQIEFSPLERTIVDTYKALQALTQ